MGAPVTFNDLQFVEVGEGWAGIRRAYVLFRNGFGASVVTSPMFYGSSDLYELAVMDRDGKIRYDTPIAEDVIKYLTRGEVTDLLARIAALPATQRRRRPAARRASTPRPAEPLPIRAMED